MKKIVFINLGDYGSTGEIIRGISKMTENAGYESFRVFPDNPLNGNVSNNDIVICSDFWRRLNRRIAYYTGYNGCFSFVSTCRLLKKIKRISPQVIHMHNLHGDFINLPLFFKFIKKNKIRVIWTLHDCWAFTGQCAHFQSIECDKWKSGCYNCTQNNCYPGSRKDNSRAMYKLKKKWFSNLEKPIIVTPSNWLSEMVKKSFLKDYEIKVINNGIDLNVFKPTASNLRKKLNIENKIVILGCASTWSERKGLDIFFSLAEKLNSNYQIVLIGVSKEQKKTLPDNIIGVERTANRVELAKYYTMADIFVNPTREDNFPTVNIEALACGIPVITFNTGGSPEIIDDSCGMISETKDADGIMLCISELLSKKNIRDNCIKRAENFDMNNKFLEYIELYME